MQALYQLLWYLRFICHSNEAGFFPPSGCVKDFKSIKLCNPTAHGKLMKTRQWDINLK